MTLNIHIADTTQPLNAELFSQLCVLAGMGATAPSASPETGEKRAYTPRGTETQVQRYARIRTELAQELGRDVIPAKATNAEMQARTLCPVNTDWKDARARVNALALVGFVLAGDDDSGIVRAGAGQGEGELGDDVSEYEGEDDAETPLQAMLRAASEADDEQE